EDATLLLEILDDRLDDEITIPQVVESGRALDASERFVALIAGELPPRDRGVHRSANALQPPLERGVVDFVHERVIAGAGNSLGDPRAHEAAANHAYSPDLHRHPLS